PSEPWAFGGAWRPRVQCRPRTSHGRRRGDGARLLRRGGHPLPDQDSDGGPDQRQDPCSDAEDDGNDHDQDPEKAPEEGEGCEQRREGDHDDDPADGEAEESAQESEPKRFSHLFHEEPGEEPDDESAMRIQYAPSPAPMKVSSPNTIPSTKPINQTTPSFILVISCRPVASRARTAWRGR